MKGLGLSLVQAAVKSLSSFLLRQLFFRISRLIVPGWLQERCLPGEACPPRPVYRHLSAKMAQNHMTESPMDCRGDREQAGSIVSDLESLEEYYAELGARSASPAVSRKVGTMHDFTQIGIFTAKRNFADTLDHLEPAYKHEFLRWIQDEYMRDYHRGQADERIRVAEAHGFRTSGGECVSAHARSQQRSQICHEITLT